MWTRGLMAKQVQNGCTCGGCGAQRWTPADCANCGFHTLEARRREKLKLVRLKNGLMGYNVGR